MQDRPQRRAGRRRSAPARIVAGVHPVRELLRSGATVEELHVAQQRHLSAPVQEILDLAAAAGIAVRSVGREALDDLTHGTAHQGLVAVAPPFAYRQLGDLLAAVPHSEAPLLVALDGVTDPHNLGSIARTAEAVGAHGLLVPARRAVGVTPAAEKAAAGAFAHLPVGRVTNLVRALGELGERQVWAVGLDADGDTQLTACDLLTEPVVVVVGAEGRGLARLTAETCDQLVALPMRGRVRSLNASIAAAVVLYEARRRREEAAPTGAPPAGTTGPGRPDV
ncbi:MAG TPA: 23S rRNA (guanosine(2251)-2'-O)-methyltransferase RlmB [Nitriliruptorales bacterium]|nr:23S rRNA (guanosine(2251)-2'-O)-methyltransferase RlmB [Nitriliruptorales bacterium]